MSRFSDCYVGNSGRYMEYGTFTSSSDVAMPNSSAEPLAGAGMRPIEKLDLVQPIQDELACGDESADAV